MDGMADAAKQAIGTGDATMAATPSRSLQDDLAAVTAATRPGPIVDETHPTLRNASLQDDLRAVTAQTAGSRGDGTRQPMEPSRLDYETVRGYVEAKPELVAGVGKSRIPNKDKVAYLSKFLQPGSDVSHLKDPVLDALYNTAQLAQQDGYTPTIGAGTNGRHSAKSSHYFGEAVDLSFKDKKGNYLNDAEMIQAGRRYGELAGWGSMRDEWTQGLPGNTYANAHLHMDWGHGAGPKGDKAVTYFRDRDTSTPEGMQPFNVDAASKDAQNRPAPAFAKGLPDRAEAIAKAVGIPSDSFVRMIQAESNFNPNAVSGVGARGIAQFMPETAAEMCRKHGWNLAEFWKDPNLQMRGAAEYIKENLQKFGGNEAQAYAAYNMGPQGVADVIAGKKSLPNETQLYVNKIMGPLDPSVTNLDAAASNVIKGGGRKWVPGGDEQTAHDTVQRMSGAAQTLTQRIFGADTFSEFASTFAGSYNDPKSPGSPLYNKSKMAIEGDSKLDYLKGTINQSLDFLQDMANGLTMSLVPRSERFKDIGKLGEGGDWIQKGAGVLGGGGQMLGGLLFFESAMAKLLGTTGGALGGLNVARGAIPETAGLLSKGLEGTLQLERYHGMLSLGGLAFMDGTVSTMANWYRGEDESLKDADHMTVMKHALGNGMMSSLSVLAMMGAGTLLQGSVPVVARGMGAGAGAAWRQLLESRSLPAQMALGGVLGTAGSTTSAAIFNMTGLSDKVFGGEVPIPEAAFLGGVGGAAFGGMAPYMPQHSPFGEMKWKLGGGPVSNAIRAGAEKILGANPELVSALKAKAMEQVATKTNGEYMAAGQISLDTIQAHVGRLEQSRDIAQKGQEQAQRDLEMAVKTFDALGQRKEGLEKAFPQDTDSFNKLKGALQTSQVMEQAAAQRMGQAGQDPKALKDAATLHEQAQSRVQKNMDSMIKFMADRPHLNEYGNLSLETERMQPQVAQAKVAFEAKQKEFQDRKLGFDHMLALSSDLAEGIKSGMAEWQALHPQGDGKNPSSALQFLSNKLKEIVTAPVQHDTPWNRALKNGDFEHFNSPEGRKIREIQYQNYRENFVGDVLGSIQGAADLQDALSVKTNQAVKMLDPTGQAGEHAGIGPQIRATYDSIAQAHVFLESQLGMTDGKSYFKPFSPTLPDGKGEKSQTVQTMRFLQSQGKFRYAIPEFETKVDKNGREAIVKGAAAKAKDTFRDTHLLKTDFLMTVQGLGETLGSAPELKTEPFFVRLGQDGVVDIPHIKGEGDLQALLVQAKAAHVSGQDWVAFKGDAKQVERLLKAYTEKIRPSQERLDSLKEGLANYKELMKEMPVAQRPGFDLSRAYNPDYMANNIHESFHQLGQYDKIADAVKSGDKAAIQEVIKNETAIFQANLLDIALTDQERVGVGKYFKEDGKNSQAAVLKSTYQNRELGLTQDSGVTRSPLLEQILNTIHSPGEADAITLDKANLWKPDKSVLTLNAQQTATVDEAIRSLALGPVQGRSPGDIRGLVAIQFGNSVYAHKQGWSLLMDKLLTPFEALIKEASGEVRGDRSRSEWKGLADRGLTPDQFKKDLIAVQEDSSKFPDFARKYGDKGKTALYYSNRIKGMLETITSGNPDLKNYMRANYVAASFPKYTDHWLKTQANNPSANLRTGLSSENLRDFSTREELQKHVQLQKSRIEGKGYTQEQFKALTLKERMNILHPEGMGGRTSEELLKHDPKRFEKLARDVEMATNADLFDTTDDDPTSVFRRQIGAMLRAQETRQLMNILSNTSVDVGGQKGTPTMRALLRVKDPGESNFSKHTYRDGKEAPYVQFSSIPGMDAFTAEVNGRSVKASDIEVHPEVYGFLAHTAIQDPSKFASSGLVANWKRMIGAIRGYSLMGGWLPHMRNNQAMRMGEFVMAPLRAFAADEAGRHMIDGANRDMQLATFNAVRSGVNMRTVQEASRGVMQSMIDQMGPEAANRMLGVANDKVGKFLQAININDPANKAAYNQLGGLGKFFSDVLGAPITLDHIMMREGAHKNIQAGMIGGFYHTREVLAQKNAGYLATLAPEARARTLDQMAAQLTNHKASALPFYMQSTTFREAFGNTFMSPNWLMAKSHMVIDFLDAGLGLRNSMAGKLTPDQMEVSSLLNKMGVADRKYAGYSPEIKQAIRSRMAATLAGSMFASFIGLQVFQHMIDGTDTLHGRAPDKWGALKVGDRYMSGLVAGNIRDVIEFATGAVQGPAPAFEKVKSIIERNLLPTDRAVGELAANRDGAGKPIYGDYRDEPVAAAAFTRDVAGYMAKSFINFDDTLGYKTNTQLSDMVGNALAGPGGVAPNAMTGKEYVLRMLGAYDAKDNWAGAVRADLQHRQSFYKQDLERRVQPFLDAAKMTQDPAKQQEYIQAGWAMATKGLPVLDEELAKYSPDGRYRMTSKMYTDAILRTMNPDLWAAKQEKKSMAGQAFAQKNATHLGQESGQQQGPGAPPGG